MIKLSKKYLGKMLNFVMAILAGVALGMAIAIGITIIFDMKDN